jgi:hypothetical protein
MERFSVEPNSEQQVQVSSTLAGAGSHDRRHLSGLKACPPDAEDVKAAKTAKKLCRVDISSINNDLPVSVGHQDHLSEEFRRRFISRGDKDRKSYSPWPSQPKSFVKDRKTFSSLNSLRPFSEGNRGKGDLAVTENEKCQTFISKRPRHADGKVKSREIPVKPKRTLASYLFSEFPHKEEKSSEIAKEHNAPLDKNSQHTNRTTSLMTPRSPHEQTERAPVIEKKQSELRRGFLKDQKRERQHISAKQQEVERNHRGQIKSLSDHDRHECCQKAVGHTGLDVGKGKTVGNQSEVKKSHRVQMPSHVRGVKNYGVL